jgi:hypothetical protein
MQNFTTGIIRANRKKIILFFVSLLNSKIKLKGTIHILYNIIYECMCVCVYVL